MMFVPPCHHMLFNAGVSAIGWREFGGIKVYDASNCRGCRHASLASTEPRRPFVQEGSKTIERPNHGRASCNLLRRRVPLTPWSTQSAEASPCREGLLVCPLRPRAAMGYLREMHYFNDLS